MNRSQGKHALFDYSNTAVRFNCTTQRISVLTRGASSSYTVTDDGRGVSWHKSYIELRVSYRETRILQNEAQKTETVENTAGGALQGNRSVSGEYDK